MSEFVARGTGVHYNSDRARPELLVPTTKGAHVWALMAAFVLSDSALDKAMAGEVTPMDAENLAYTGIGCYACEEPYTPRMRSRRCKATS